MLRVAVILGHAAYIYPVFAELALKALADASARIDDLHAVALPPIKAVVADSSITTRSTRTFVHVDVTIAAQGGVQSEIVVALHHGTLRPDLADEVIFANAIGEACDAYATIRVNADKLFGCGICTRSAILARVAAAFVHVNIAVASQRVVVLAILYPALMNVRADEVVLAHTVGKPRGTRACVCVGR